MLFAHPLSLWGKIFFPTDSFKWTSLIVYDIILHNLMSVVITVFFLDTGVNIIPFFFCLFVQFIIVNKIWKTAMWKLITEKTLKTTLSTLINHQCKQFFVTLSGNLAKKIEWNRGNSGKLCFCDWTEWCKFLTFSSTRQIRINGADSVSRSKISFLVAIKFLCIQTKTKNQQAVFYIINLTQFFFE